MINVPDSKKLWESSTKGFIVKNSSKRVPKNENGSTQHVPTGAGTDDSEAPS